MPPEKAEFLKGTLDMLILKVVATGAIHGYAISQRIQQISRDFFQVPQGSLYPALHRLEDGAGSMPSGKIPTPAVKPSSTPSRERAESSWKPRCSIGSSSPTPWR